MALDLTHKILTGVIAGLLVIGGVGGWQLLKTHDAKLLAEQKIASDAAAQKSLDEHTQQIRAAAQAEIDQVKADAAKQVTPQQIAQWLPRQVPVPQPLTINIPPATKENPTPDAVATIPQADLPALKDYAVTCSTCELQLKQIASELADTKGKLALEQATSDALRTENKGTAWSRTRRTLKWIGITAAAGVIGYEAGKHK
jgi:hypothetical protein